MKQLEEFMLNVWREACRHIEIGESTATISEVLTCWMPLERLVVLLIDKDRRHVETLAVSPDEGVKEYGIEEKIWMSADIERLLDWCHRGEVSLRKAGEKLKQIPPAVIPSFLRGDVLIGPLISRHDTFGLLLLEAKSSHKFSAEDEIICKRLLEPFAVAVENDHRLRELNALREAAEADNLSLLSRLGRDNLSDTIIGVDGGLRSVMERVGLVARSDVPVLILGETGSGKEVVARAIHNYSPHASGPFIRVNCGAIPPELIDSELFGHEKGSFTGAISTRRGWFERADGGTLFLDEIGELPQAAQIRLLRVLQDGSFERVGGERSMKVDVRVVAATHRALGLMVQNGDFREDLWYRVAVFPIVLPPLRERREDISALADHFARRAAARLGLKLRMPTAQDISLLLSYDWPGNVREFSSVIDRAALLGNGERLEVAKALGVSTDVTTQIKTKKPLQGSDEPNADAVVLSLDMMTKLHIETALTVTHGRIEGTHGAAALLQINPHTLRAKMRKLGIDWTNFRPGRR